MLNGIIGKKVGMTQHFTEDGTRVPVTVVQCGPVTVIQKKTMEKDGYEAVQVGYDEIKEGKLKNVTKAAKGHFGDNQPTKHLREFKAVDMSAIEVGQKIDGLIFKAGDIVDVSGTSKGRGFAGVVKRWGFKGGCASHGHRFHRTTGSIGQSATPARVFKNKKMPGQYGNSKATSQGLEVIAVDTELNVMLIKGSIPGANGRVVEVNKTSKG